MSDTAAAKRDQILDAALGVFGRYGYRRTSMELLAQSAGVSRPALYLHFHGKEDVFRAMGRRLLDEVLAAAQTARDADGTVRDRLYGVLAVKLDFLVASVDAEFRAELLAEAGAVADDLVKSFKEGHLALVEALLESAAGELELLDVVLSARDAALLLVDALTGISQAGESPEVLRHRLRQMVDLTVRSLTAHSPAGG
ncbi:TetR family transcriptional regulator [Actinomadura scrupuli]|uniref:TetR family transcriptional regulator n=1 Tax=Actinomadura scrupuli TaxID=559629 RepID=UPI003D953A8D